MLLKNLTVKNKNPSGYKGVLFDKGTPGKEIAIKGKLSLLETISSGAKAVSQVCDVDEKMHVHKVLADKVYCTHCNSYYERG